MKINKIKLFESEDAEVTPIENVSELPVEEIADTVQAAAEEEGKKVSDQKAEEIAITIKTAATGLDKAAWAPLDVKSALTDALDDCLAEAMFNKKMKRTDGTDLLIDGLPGSGKTAIVKQWAKDRDVKLVYINAKDSELDAVLNGFPVAIDDVDADGKPVKIADKAYSRSLKALDENNSVLFLDEFNRALMDRRASLLTLINEHQVAGPGPDGYYTFDKLLFTVACVNPAVPTDPGVIDLNDAEMSRFVDKLIWDSDPEETLKFMMFDCNKAIQAALDLPSDDPEFPYVYTKEVKIKELAKALLGDYRFKFNSREDLNDLDLGDESTKGKATMLNGRSITDAIRKHGASKKKFLNWVDNGSKYLQVKKDMIHEILDSYVEPVVTIPDRGNTNTAKNNTVAEVPTDSVDTDDFDALITGDEIESDSTLFPSAAQNTKKVATAAEAKARLQNLKFN